MQANFSHILTWKSKNINVLCWKVVREIINDFAERGIYDVCLEDFSSNLSSFNLVAELGENVLRKVNYEMQRLIDAKNKGMESAYKSAA